MRSDVAALATLLVLALVPTVLGQISCEQRLSCIDCMYADTSCRYCGATSMCIPKGTLDLDCATAYVDSQGHCPDQQCSWYKLTLNPSVCATAFPILFGLAVLALLLGTLFLPLLFSLSQSPWARRGFDDANICVFTHATTDGSKVCARCGVVAADLYSVGPAATRICLGCRAVYTARGTLSIAFALDAMAISIVMVGWTSAGIGFAMLAIVAILYAIAARTLFRGPVRRFLVGTPAGYSSIGARVTEQDLSDAQLNVLAFLPPRLRASVVASLRDDEDVLWAEHPPWKEVLRRDFTARTQIAAFFAYTLPMLFTGVLLYAVLASRAAMFLFMALSLLMACISGPALVPLILRSRCGYVITTRRAMIVRPLLIGGVMVDGTDFRVLRELAIITDPTGGAGSVTWKNIFFPGFFYVSNTARVREIIAAQSAAAMAAQAAAMANAGMAENASDIELGDRDGIAAAVEAEGTVPSAADEMLGGAQSAPAPAAAVDPERAADAEAATVGDSLLATARIEAARVQMLTQTMATLRTYRFYVYAPAVLVLAAAVATAMGLFPFVLFAALGPFGLCLTGVVYQSYAQLAATAQGLHSHRYVAIMLPDTVEVE